MKKKEKSAEQTAKPTKAKAQPKPKAPVAETKAAQEGRMKKQYAPDGTLCKVTFLLPSEATNGATSVMVVGDFNGWATDKTPLKRQKDGSFIAMIELEAGKEYRFKYLIDGTKWENDWSADKYLPNPHGGDDSVVVA